VPLPTFRSVAARMDGVRSPVRLRGISPDAVERLLDPDDLFWLGYRSGPNGPSLDELCPTVAAGDHRVAVDNTRGYMDGRDKGLWQVHRHLKDHEAVSLRSLLARHDRSERSRAHHVLWYNTYLLRPFWVGVPGSGRMFQIEATPDSDHRRTQIGAAIEEVGYSIAGLCEVWNDDDRGALLREIPHRESKTGVRTPTVGSGPLGVESLKGSGLVTLTRGPDDARPHIMRDEHTTFSDQGEPFRDTDAYSRKGVLLTEIDLGPGHLDLYTTHLISGGGVPETIRASMSGFPLRPLREIRARQIRELAEFIARTHKPENPALVLGDFNVHAKPGDAATEYQGLLKAMYALGLQDAWLGRGSPWGDSYEPASACERDATSGPAGLCVDYPEDRGPAEESNRFDYVFLEFPSPHHAFQLDIGRIRRASFWRGGDEPPPYLSDHLGLDFTLVASPR